MREGTQLRFDERGNLHDFATIDAPWKSFDISSREPALEQWENGVCVHREYMRHGKLHDPEPALNHGRAALERMNETGAVWLRERYRFGKLHSNIYPATEEKRGDTHRRDWYKNGIQLWDGNKPETRITIPRDKLREVLVRLVIGHPHVKEDDDYMGWAEDLLKGRKRAIGFARDASHGMSKKHMALCWSKSSDLERKAAYAAASCAASGVMPEVVLFGAWTTQEEFLSIVRAIPWAVVDQEIEPYSKPVLAFSSIS